MISLNPFLHAMGKGKKASLHERFKFTFDAFFGTLFSNKQEHVGIFDYLLLGLPALVAILCFACWAILQSSTTIYNADLAFILLVGAVVLPIPMLLLLVGRYAFAFVATLLVSPIVLLVHLAMPTCDSPTEGYRLGDRNRAQRQDDTCNTNNVTDDNVIEEPVCFVGIGGFAPHPEIKLDAEELNQNNCFALN